MRILGGVGGARGGVDGRVGGPFAIFEDEMIFAAEAQQREAVLREGCGMAAEFFDDAGVVENRVPQKIGEEDFQQRGQAADFSGAACEGVDDFLRGFFEAGDEDGAALVLRFGERFG